MKWTAGGRAVCDRHRERHPGRPAYPGSPPGWPAPVDLQGV